MFEGHLGSGKAKQEINHQSPSNKLLNVLNLKKYAQPMQWLLRLIFEY